MLKSPGYTWSVKYERTVKNKQFMTRISNNPWGARLKISKYQKGYNFQETYRVFCLKQAGQIWISDNDEFTVVLTRFRAAKVQRERDS